MAMMPTQQEQAQRALHNEPRTLNEEPRREEIRRETTASNAPPPGRRPEGVAVPPVPAQQRELSEAEKTLARQQAVAGETGDKTPAQAKLDAAKEMSMTDRPDEVAIERAHREPVIDPDTGKPAIEKLTRD